MIAVCSRVVLWPWHTPSVHVVSARARKARGTHGEHWLRLWVRSGWKAVWIIHRKQC